MVDKARMQEAESRANELEQRVRVGDHACCMLPPFVPNADRHFILFCLASKRGAREEQSGG